MNKLYANSFGRLFLTMLMTGLASVYAGTAGTTGAAGNLDQTFGTNGVTVTSLAGTNGVVNSILLQGDGKLLVFASDQVVLRYTTSGVPDKTFGSNGIAMLSTPIGGSLALQPDGQIVIGGVVTSSTGEAELGAIRLNTDGTQDISFGSDGSVVVGLGNRVPNVGTALLLQPSGDMVVCSTLISAGRGQPYQTALARFTSTGAVDTSFGSQGLSIQTGVNGCTTMALLSNGDYLVVNMESVAEFSPNGTAESAVTNGTILAASQTTAGLVPSIFDITGDYLFGTELFVGEESRSHNSSAEVLSFTQTGNQRFNTTFHFIGAGGSGIQTLVDGLASLGNGDIVTVGLQITFSQTGTTTVNGLARLTASGGLDPTFGQAGTVVNNIPATSVAVQSNGDIVTAGFASNNTDLTLARYLGQ
jgi:uncharacterized delta-60 repeat protein